MTINGISPLQGVRRQLCPRCRTGLIFRAPVYRSPLAMWESCAVCGLKYEREQGYFLGAMYVSYALSIPPILVLVPLVWKLSRWPFDVALAASVIVYLPFVPPMMRLARVVWMYVDQAFDPR